MPTSLDRSVCEFVVSQGSPLDGAVFSHGPVRFSKRSSYFDVWFEGRGLPLELAIQVHEMYHKRGHLGKVVRAGGYPGGRHPRLMAVAYRAGTNERIVCGLNRADNVVGTRIAINKWGSIDKEFFVQSYQVDSQEALDLFLKVVGSDFAT